MSIYENKWQHVNTFEELCFLGALYVNDIIKNFPLYPDNTYDEKNLYELIGEFEWIQSIIYKYNMLNYFTYISQPGLYDIYIDINDIEYVYYQRACVAGFIDKNKAKYIYDKMTTNENYKICIEDINESVEPIYEPCSIRINYIEIDNEKYYLGHDNKTLIPINTFEITYNNYTELKYSTETHILDIIIWLKLKYFYKNENVIIYNNDSLFKHMLSSHLLNIDTKYYNKNNDSYIVYMCVMDRRWNYNGEFWSDLLKYLKEYDEIKN